MFHPLVLIYLITMSLYFLSAFLQFTLPPLPTISTTNLLSDVWSLKKKINEQT